MRLALSMPPSIAAVLLCGAYGVAAGGEAVRLSGSADVVQLPRAEPNDQRTPAGRMVDGELRIELEAVEAAWYPRGADGPRIITPAFAEVGRPPQVPGPLIRTAAGTPVRVTVRNTRDRAISMRGLLDRASMGTIERPANADPEFFFADSLVVPAGEVREVRFTPGSPVSSFYYGRVALPEDGYPGPPIPGGFGSEGVFLGGLVVDPAGAGPPTDERVIVITRWAGRDEPSTLSVTFKMMLNGLSWPHTERLRYSVGDTVRWRIINASAIAHPMHLHGFYFSVDARGDTDADTTYAPPDRRSAVTDVMPDFSSLRLTWVPQQSGNWLFHCHLIRHMSSLQGFAEEAGPSTDPMAGLVVGITVEPRSEDTAQEPPPERTIHLWTASAPGVFGEAPALSFVACESPSAPPQDTMVVPGTPLVLERGEPADIVVHNRLDRPLSVHWHGLEVRSLYDGVAHWSGRPGATRPPIAPGDSARVRITAPRAGTFIYHIHGEARHELSQGLYGPFLVLPEGETWDRERDRVFLLAARGARRDPPPVINGATAPGPERFSPGRAYRLRFIHLSPDAFAKRVRLLKEGEPVTWRPLAKDGADLPAGDRAPRVADVELGVGETYDFEWTPAVPGAYTLEVVTTHYSASGLPPTVQRVALGVGEVGDEALAAAARVEPPAPPFSPLDTVPAITVPADELRHLVGSYTAPGVPVDFTVTMEANGNLMLTVTGQEPGPLVPIAPGVFRWGERGSARVEFESTDSGTMLLVFGMRLKARADSAGPPISSDAAGVSRPTANPDSAIVFGVADEFFAEYAARAANLDYPGALHDRLSDNSLAGLRRWQEREDEWLNRLDAVDADALWGSAAWALYISLRERLEASVQFRVCRRPLWNVDPDWGWHIDFKLPDLARSQPVGTPAARAAALRRWSGFGRFVDTEIDNLRQGMREGYVAPRAFVEEVIEQVGRLAGQAPESSTFYDPARRDTTPEFREAFGRILRDEILPALRRYQLFLSQEYLPRARSDVGLTSMPDGLECYRAFLRRTTGLPLDETHVDSIGQALLPRVLAARDSVARTRYGLSDGRALSEAIAGDSALMWGSHAEALAAARSAVARAADLLPRYFSRLPPIPPLVVDTMTTEDALNASYGAYYAGFPTDTAQPARVIVNPMIFDHPGNRGGLGPLAYHEGLPGHHLQAAFDRAFGPSHRYALYADDDGMAGIAGFMEGWATYAAHFLALEMGLLSDAEILVRSDHEISQLLWFLITDGIHMRGWSGEQVRDTVRQYLRAGLDDDVLHDAWIVAAATPGYTLNYLLGALEIQRLRTLAERELGASFDLREFHDQMLRYGDIPLGALRVVVQRWIRETLRRTATLPEARAPGSPPVAIEYTLQGVQKMRSRLSTVLALLLSVPGVSPLAAQGGVEASGAYTGPIIDMHLHAYGDAEFPARPAPNPTTRQPSVRTAGEHMERSLEIMRRYSIVLGAVCGARGVEAVNSWHESEPDRVLRGIGPDDPTEFMDPSRFRELVEGGGVDVVCEVGAQYAGYSPSDSAFSPYWAIAQEHGIPVGIHTGSSFPGRPYRGSPNFRLRFGNPLLLEDMLVEYPDLKVYMMHAGGGGPYAEYAFMMMGMYPQLYTDIALLTWLPPPDVLEGFLRDAKRMGLLDRIMFGTDQMTWPEAIGMAVDRINGYDFLSLEEKAGIFYDNAARFLGLSEEVIARHRAMADRNGASR